MKQLWTNFTAPKWNQRLELCLSPDRNTSDRFWSSTESRLLVWKSCLLRSLCSKSGNELFSLSAARSNTWQSWVAVTHSLMDLDSSCLTEMERCFSCSAPQESGKGRHRPFLSFLHERHPRTRHPQQRTPHIFLLHDFVLNCTLSKQDKRLCIGVKSLERCDNLFEIARRFCTKQAMTLTGQLHTRSEYLLLVWFFYPFPCVFYHKVPVLASIFPAGRRQKSRGISDHASRTRWRCWMFSPFFKPQQAFNKWRIPFISTAFKAFLSP